LGLGLGCGQGVALVDDEEAVVDNLLHLGQVRLEGRLVLGVGVGLGGRG